MFPSQARQGSWQKIRSLVPVWPDLAKFHHFGKILKLLGNFFEGSVGIWAKFWTHFGKSFILFDKFSLF